MTEPRRKWTFMVYMAGDNGRIRRPDNRPLMDPMEDEGRRDIVEMQRVGSTAEVAILAQFDTLAATYRYYIGPQGQIVEIELPGQNTGDPDALRDFVVWGMTRYPAEHYAVILWSHGSGWKEDDIYAFARKKQMPIAAGQSEVRGAVARASRKSGRSRIGSGFFLKSAARVVGIDDPAIRGICYDDGSMDFLDNAEMKRALAEAEAAAGAAIDLLGMDACLMAMFEVAYQVKDVAAYLVASQEDEPIAGWPYDRVLEPLVRNPDMTAPDLARHIVKAYGAAFTGGGRGLREGITQSAVDLAALPPVAAGLQGLAAQLKRGADARDPLMDSAFFRAGASVVRFADKDYADLRDYVGLLKRWYAGADQDVRRAVDSALAALRSSEKPLVLENFAAGPAPYERATGLSIYVPQTNRYSAFYDGLDCAALGWNDFICAMNLVPASKRLQN